MATRLRNPGIGFPSRYINAPGISSTINDGPTLATSSTYCYHARHKTQAAAIIGNHRIVMLQKTGSISTGRQLPRRAVAGRRCSVIATKEAPGRVGGLAPEGGLQGAGGAGKACSEHSGGPRYLP